MSEEIQSHSPEAVLEKFLPDITFEGVVDPALARLTNRQQAVLLLRAMGLTNREIGRSLKIDSGTVNSMLQQCDPEHRFRLTREQVKQVQKAYWLRIQNLAFQRLDGDSMEDVSPAKAVKMAEQAQNALDKMEGGGVSKASAGELLKKLCEMKKVSDERKELEKHG